MSYQPDKSELISASNHLFYEVKQFDATSALLFARKSLEINHGMMDPKDKKHRIFAIETTTNAFLESFLIHLRIILEFLFKKEAGKGKDDIISKYYMDETDWSKMITELEKILTGVDLDDLKKRVNTEIVHLSFERNKKDTKTKQWEYLKLRENVLKACLVFYKYANKELFSSTSKGYFEHISREYGPV